MTAPRQASRDSRIEREVSNLLDRGDPHAAWIRTGYMGSAILRRAWYTKIKAALPIVEKKA